MSPSQKAELVQDIDREMANAKHNSYADGYNAGKLQGAAEAAPDCPAHDTRCNAFRCAVEAQGGIIPTATQFAENEKQRSDRALATQAYVQEQIAKSWDRGAAETFSRYTDWGGRLEHLELLVKRAPKAATHEAHCLLEDRVSVGLKTQDQRLTTLEARIEDLRSITNGERTRIAARIEALEQWSKLADEKGAALADVRNLRDEHKPILDGLAVRAVELVNRTNGLADSLDNLNGELKLTDAGLGALERKVEQMEARAQAMPASVCETEAYSRWSSQPWSGDLEHLNAFFGNATGDTHRNASDAMDAAFRAGFRAARG